MAYDSITPENLGQDDLAITPSFTVLRTTPAYSADYVKSIDIANNGTATAVVSVHLVPSGGTPDNSNILIPSISIKKKSIFQWTGSRAIFEGWTIQAQSSIAGVCVGVGGGNGI